MVALPNDKKIIFGTEILDKNKDTNVDLTKIDYCNWVVVSHRFMIHEVGDWSRDCRNKTISDIPINNRRIEPHSWFTAKPWKEQKRIFLISIPQLIDKLFCKFCSTPFFMKRCDSKVRGPGIWRSQIFSFEIFLII